ncbi:hypothetical protein EON66_04510 [archaeon]|nr:MAG: hypothetical protein EON66_04510 [archaeon]
MLGHFPGSGARNTCARASLVMILFCRQHAKQHEASTALRHLLSSSAPAIEYCWCCPSPLTCAPFTALV